MDYEIKLDMFQGPFELLYYLIEKDEIDIYHIPIAKITDEYLAHLKMMRELNIEVASEFIVMAASLLYIKSRALLPELEEPPMDDDEIPAEELYFRTQEEMTKQLETYRLYKEAARWLGIFEQERKKIYLRTCSPRLNMQEKINFQNLCLKDLFDSFQKMISRLKVGAIQKILLQKISIEEKIAEILEFLSKRENSAYFFQLISECEDRYEIIVTFLAILELARMSRIQIWQHKNFADFKIEAVLEESAAA